MPGDYAALSLIYDVTGTGDFAEAMTPRLVNFAQRNGWMGRQMMDMGCGSGRSLIWLAQHSYSVIAVDNSPEMLALAQKNFETAKASNERMLDPIWLEQDMRAVDRPDSTDMVIALNTLHEMTDSKTLTDVFKTAYSLLRSGRIFIFDFYTIEGLVKRAENTGTLHEDNTLNVFMENSYDFDRQIQTRRYIIFRKNADNQWERLEAQRTLRSYPIQVIRGILQRTGFGNIEVITTDLNRYTGQSGTARVIFVAWKQ